MAEPDKIFLTPAELAKRWRGRVTLRTLKNWRYSKRRHGPKYIRIAGRVLYQLSDIEEYEQTNKL